jgi:predicted RNase H-like HicB family nuclease
MKVSAVVSLLEEHRWLAQCEEVDRAGEGDTPEQALARLREALEEYFGQAEAVAPPSQQPREPIEIVVVDAPAGVDERPGPAAGTTRGSGELTR